MSRDPKRDWIEGELIWFRKQRGAFDERLAGSKDLLRMLGGGNLRHVRHEMERIRREHGSDPESDVAAYFYTAGYQTPGENLDQRLKSYQERHHVVERTALRRSDRGAVAVAQLLRERLKYDRPWAHIVARQDGAELKVYLAFNVHRRTSFAPPAIRINGKSHPFDPKESEFQGHTRYTQYLPSITLDPSVDEDEPLAQVMMAWVPFVAPSWELVSNMADSRLLSRLTIDPFPLVTLSIQWWDESAARSGNDVPLSSIS